MKEVVDLDELVGLLSYVMEGIELAPQREVPWGGISRLVKDINVRTTRLRESTEHVTPQQFTPQAITRPTQPAIAAPVRQEPKDEPIAPILTTPSLDDSRPVASPATIAQPASQPAPQPAPESELETEVDSGLQASPLARRIQMAPRVSSGRVREVNVQSPSAPSSPGAR